MELFLLGFILVMILLGLLFLSMEQARLKNHRNMLYLAMLREHRYWHSCNGGLSVDEDGKIEHFGQNQEAGYDADRNIPSTK